MAGLLPNFTSEPSNLLKTLFMCLLGGEHVHPMAPVWWSETMLWSWFFLPSLYCSRNWSGSPSKHLYPLSQCLDRGVYWGNDSLEMCGSCSCLQLQIHLLWMTLGVVALFVLPIEARIFWLVIHWKACYSVLNIMFFQMLFIPNIYSKLMYFIRKTTLKKCILLSFTKKQYQKNAKTIADFKDSIEILLKYLFFQDIQQKRRCFNVYKDLQLRSVLRMLKSFKISYWKAFSVGQ